MANTENNPLTNSAITDLVGLFRLSGMVDQVRDATAFLLQAESEARDSVQALAACYMAVRESLPETLAADEGPHVASWAPEVDPQTVSLAGLHAAAALLARWCDLIYQTPTFVTQQKVSLASAQKMSEQIDAAMQKRGGDNDAKERVGTYI